MIGACSTTRDEADIIEVCVGNLLDQGVDRIIVADASVDGTREILAGFPEVAILDASGPWHEQEHWMNYAAQMLGDAGCEWIVPFDADEFWFGPDGLSVAHYLATLPPDVGQIGARLWHHRDWDHKYLPAERLPKVAFRWVDGAVIAVGNHSVSLPGDWKVAVGLEIRHYQYRGLDHFRRKIRGNTASLQQWELDRGDGIHVTQYAHLSDDELAAVYAEHTSREVLYDPVPVHGRHRVDPRTA